MENKNKYFAAKEDPSDVVASLDKRSGSWYSELKSNGYLEKVRRSWAMYHGAHFEDKESHKITFGGDQGELVNLTVNHFRNIAVHLLNMTTSNRPAVNTRATNTDYKSQNQTILANGLLDYYLREKRLEEFLKNATENAIVLGEGYIRIEWDATAGDPVDFNEETMTEIREGDIKYTNLSPFDVVRDSNREDNDHDWLIVRTYKNRYDLAAKYPELEDEILSVQTKDRLGAYSNRAMYDDTDLIPVYEFFHKRSDALPDGRYIIYVSSDAVLFDGALPYRDIPVYRISPSNIIGTPYGYTPMFDLIPLQENLNSLYSAVATNQNAFAVQNVLVPKNSDIVISQLAGNLNVIEYDPNRGKPEPMNLTSTPAEIFRTIQIIEQNMETLSGINSVTRGNPEASLQTGAALALIQAQAVQFSSGLQSSYVRLIEDVCSATIKILRDYASAPRVAAISGKSNRTKMQEFTGDDLSQINRVIVEIANPISKTTAGRLEMAGQLLQMQLLKNTDQYFTVLNTGRLDSMIEGEQAELLLIRAENERMMEGQAVIVMALDQHMTHIAEHKALLADPDFRQNPELAQLVLDHITEHITQLRTVDPDLLQLAGQQPLQPAQPGLEGAVQEMGQAEKVPGEQSLNNPADLSEVTEQLPVGQESVAQLPSMPRPPAPFQDMPLTPGME
jgi:hypothetical protein